MYFWNYKKLADDFTNGKVTEKQRLLYFLIPIIFEFIGIISKVILTFIAESEIDNLASDIIPNSVMLSIITFETFFMLMFMIVMYKINSKIDDKDFLGRYFSFKFISIIRSAVFSFLLLFVFYAINTLYNRWALISYELIIVFMISLIYSYYIQITSLLYLKNYHENRKLKRQNIKKTISTKVNNRKSSRKINIKRR